jgi:hypothetical protein
MPANANAAEVENGPAPTVAVAKVDPSPPDAGAVDYKVNFAYAHVIDLRESSAQIGLMV